MDMTTRLSSRQSHLKTAAWECFPADSSSNQIGILIDVEPDASPAPVDREPSPTSISRNDVFPFFELPGELRNQIYDCIVDNRDEPLPSIVVPRFRKFPILPSPFYQNKQFHDEMSERLRMLGETSRSMVYICGCTIPRLTVRDALWLTGAGMNIGWGVNPYASQLQVFFAPQGRVSVQNLVDNVGMVYAAKRFAEGAVGHLPTVNFFINLDYARLPDEQQSRPSRRGGAVSIRIEDNYSVSVENSVPGLALGKGSFIQMWHNTLADWAFRERRRERKRSNKPDRQGRVASKKIYW